MSLLKPVLARFWARGQKCFRVKSETLLRISLLGSYSGQLLALNQKRLRLNPQRPFLSKTSTKDNQTHIEPEQLSSYRQRRAVTERVYCMILQFAPVRA